METKHITYQKVIEIIKEFNNFIDTMDNKIIQAQNQYESTKSKIAEEQNLATQKFEKDCKNAIESIKEKSKNMVNEAINIQKQIEKIDNKLSEVDKYYLKTKNKKLEELSNKKSEEYNNDEDYFSVLENIKEKFTNISQKYSQDIMPSLINGLNYIFSSKRKKDYEELIVLNNTVKSFIEEIKKSMEEVEEDTLKEMEQTYSFQKQELESSQSSFKEKYENDYESKLNSIAEELDIGLNRILPDEVINLMSDLIEEYKRNYNKVNTSTNIPNNILYIGYVDYPIKDFIQSNTLISFIKQKCQKIIIDESIKFPLFLTIEDGFALYIKKSQGDREVLQKFMQGIMFSFLNLTPVMHLKLNIIDCENHGNSVNEFFDAKKKLPELFGGKIITTTDDAITKIRELNERVEYISQEILGTKYSNIVEYKKCNPEAEYGIELLTIFDFPKGLDEQSLSYLKNIIIYGKKCGIFVCISENIENTDNRYSNELLNNIQKVKEQCINIIQESNNFIFMGLEFIGNLMPSKSEFSNFLSKYILINEGIKNKGIAFPKNVKKLIESKSEEELEENIKEMKQVIANSEERYGNVLKENTKYSDSIIIGTIYYPMDLFEEAFGVEKIKEEFGTSSGKIALPLTMNLTTSCNILANYSESKNKNILEFSHNIIWSFLSNVPTTKLSCCIIDPEKKGGSILPFLDFRKECPEAFDENIYTNAEDIHEKLLKINREIDDLIQNKLSNKYDNILEYNRNNPNRAEISRLLVIYDFPSGFDARSLELLTNILKNGGRCGVYVVICNNTDIKLSAYGYDTERGYIEKIKEYMSEIEYNDREYSLLPFKLPVSIKEPLSYSKIEKFVEEYKKESISIRNKGLSFEDILEKNLFSKDLSKGLSIPVGVGDGETIVPIVFGKGSSHHALIAGATGSGKSTLLHTLIMSAMLNYPPELLNLYLMDFKSGTEFKIYEGYRLPHIKLLALDAMQEFGESILENLVEEIGERSRKFKEVNAAKISEYVQRTGKSMPKILVIMDEFQILFNDSTNRKVAYHCAELTKRIVTEGRSYGIHLLMATQSTKIISGLTLDTGTIEQMRIRIGLKCGEYDAMYLFSEKNDQKALEMMKGPIGTAVMNQEYTEEENIGFRAAYCYDETQKKYLKLIEEKLVDYPYNMQSFEGSKTTNLLDYLKDNPIDCDQSPLKVDIGTLIKVAPPLKITFDKKHKHNTLICGSNEKMTENISHLYELAILLNKNSKLYCIDGDIILGEEKPEALYDEYEKFGEKFVLARTRANIIEIIKEVYEFYENGRKEVTKNQVFVLVKNFQFLDVVKAMAKGDIVDERDYLQSNEVKQDNDEDDIANMFDFGIDDTPAETNITTKFLKLIDEGFAYGIHFIFTSMEFQSVRECMYYGENILPKFPERYVFSLGNSDADTLIDGVSVSSLQDNTVYYTDSIKNTFQLKPYVFPSKEELKKFIQ